MDKVKDGIYPVYLISEEYGSRGLDYRAQGNELGICMLICSSPSNKRSRLQTMKRICRYSDKGKYIQGKDVPDIDKQKFVEYKTKLTIAEKAVAKVLNKRKKTEKPQKGKTQLADEELNYRETMNEYLIDVMSGQKPTTEMNNMCETLTDIKSEKFKTKLVKGEDYPKDMFAPEN